MITSLKRILPEAFKDKYRMLWWRLCNWWNPPPLPCNPAGKVFVHLGCGRINHPSFVNVDAMAWPHVHHVCGVERLPMFSDETVDLIYVCHCLEHVGFRNVPATLREWLRVLKPGGRVRISVPDFDHILRLYYDFDCDLRRIETVLFGGQNYEFNYHFSVYNFSRLSVFLQEAGFTLIERWEHGCDELATMNDWSGRQFNIDGKVYPISLNMQATKPLVA